MIRKQVLDNGLTVLTESMPHVRSVCAGVWLRRGSRHETPRQNGISHFIEHLVFKGTETRSARDIALAMDASGGQLDAFTSKEATCFYAKVLDEHLPQTLELLADIVQYPLFDADELERERRVILEEIRMVEDSPEELVYDLFAESFFPRHRLGRPIQGTTGSVSAMSRRQLLHYFREAYRPERMLLVAAGNLRHANLARRVKRAFSGLRPGRRGERPAGPPRMRAAVTTRTRRELGQLHLLLGLPAFAEGSPRRYAVAVFNAILGGAMSSRLFERIREERGLAYSVYSSVNGFADSGFLGIYAATSPDQAREVIRLAMGELRALRDDGPTEQEIVTAREHLKGSMMLSLESTTSRMANLARQELYLGRQLDLAETLRGLDRVGRDEVHELARELVGSRRLALSAVGRIGRLAAARARDLPPVSEHDHVTVRVSRVPEAADLPSPAQATDGAAGFDLRARVDAPVELAPGARRLVPTGIRLALPAGYEGQVRPRSGLALREGIALVNAPGTIDSDYRGEVGVILINLGDEPVTIERGERIAQLVVQRLPRVSWLDVEELPESRRGAGGFGHSGRR